MNLLPYQGIHRTMLYGIRVFSALLLVITFVATNFLEHRGIIHSVPAGVLFAIPVGLLFSNFGFFVLAR